MWGIWVTRDGYGEWAQRETAPGDFYGSLLIFPTLAEAERQAAAWRAVSIGRNGVSFQAKAFF